jgi:hypothetical protein
MSTTFLDIKGRDAIFSGDLTVLGSSTTLNTANTTISDPLSKIALGNTTNTIDFGIYGEYDTGTTAKYAGWFKDASNADKMTFFKDLQVEPTTTVNTAGTGFAYATLVADAFEGTNIQVDATNGTIDTSSGAITIAAASGSDVLLNPEGVGQIKFYTTATDSGYSFPIDAGAAQDGFILSYDDATDALEWFDPSVFGGAATVTASAVFATANKLIISENGGDREIVETNISIDGSSNMTGVNSVTATTSMTAPTFTSSGSTTLSSGASGDIIVSPNGTGETRVNTSLIHLAQSNLTSDAVDIGFFGVMDPTASLDLYAGMFRDASDSGKFKLFETLQAAPTADLVNTAGTGFSLATLAVGALEAGNIQVDVTNGTIDTSSGSLTVSAATNSNVILDPAGTGVVNFYGAYAFPPTDGAADGYVMKTDSAGTITWVDPTTLVGIDHTFSDAVFATANRLIMSDAGGDRSEISTTIAITGGNSVSGVDNLSANTVTTGCVALVANTTLAVTYEIVAVTTGATDKTMTLPTDPVCSKKYKIIKVDAGAGDCIITASGTNTISDGVTTSYSLTNQYDYTVLMFEDTSGVWYLG